MIKHNNSCFQVMVVPSHRNQRLMCGGNYYEKNHSDRRWYCGHVTPNLALLPALREEDFEIHYIGSYNGIERRLIEAASIPYDGISSGKLRRYFDLKNFSDPLRVLKGYFEARKLMKKYKPDIVFSKGGFVAVPVVLAAKHYKVPVIIHEPI